MFKSVAIAAFLLVSSCVGPSYPNVLLLKGVTGQASGVVIADDWILTVGHTLPISVANDLICGIAITHPTLDLAMISCPGAKVHGLRLGRQPRKYNRLYSYSWHAGKHMLKTEGYQGDAPGLMSVPVIFGSSGGAVTNIHGELVGIIRGVLLMDIRDGTGAYAVSHVSQYVILDDDVREWIRGIVK